MLSFIDLLFNIISTINIKTSQKKYIKNIIDEYKDELKLFQNMILILLRNYIKNTK